MKDIPKMEEPHRTYNQGILVMAMVESHFWKTLMLNKALLMLFASKLQDIPLQIRVLYCLED
ncbi:hypothetical protein EGY04_06840 [Enterobacter roggenkampii]|nr:hypothetical protein EGY04_06840 [Enterobacter roggenkampii]